MTFPQFGEAQFLREAQQGLADQFQRRNQVNENSSRLAQDFFTYTTTGVGQIVVKQPVMFNCTFIEEPSFTSGVYIAKLPDPLHYRYPLVTSGVYKWVEELQKPDSYKAKIAAGEIVVASSAATNNGVPDPGFEAQLDAIKDKEPKFYKGAYMYFVVRVDPAANVRSDGSNLAALQTALATADATQQASLNPLIKEAKEAVYLKGNPPRTTIHHHLQFTGVAMKKLDSGLVDQVKDKEATPLTSSHFQ